MLDIASSEFGTIAALVVISFFSFIAGTICRRWPDKLQEYAELIDGSTLCLSPEAHRALIQMCGLALSAMSIGALLAATFLV
jgi:hypothetical protein